MINFGAVPASSVLPILFTSYGKTNGESITLSGLAVTDIEVYKGTSMTQRASDAGYTLLDTDGIDIDSVTGLHGFSIDLGDNTDAGFYAVGSFYTVVVSAVTIDSQAVTFIAATFRIVAAEGVAGVPDVNVTHVGDTAQTAGDICGKIGTPTDLGGGATLAQNLSDIEAQTDDIGAAGAGLTALATQASVNTIDDFLDTEVAAIKAKTDQLTFTVANQVDANMQSINDTALIGDGGATPWGP